MPRSPGAPSLGQWLRYAAGGRLPGHRDWVRHDLMDAGWQGRLLARNMLQLLPFVLVLGGLGAAFLDPLSATLLVALVPLAALITIGAAAEQVRERRLRQHGLPVPDDPDARFRDRRRY